MKGMCIMNTDIPAVAEELPVGTVLANSSSRTSSLARGASPGSHGVPRGPVPGLIHSGVEDRVLPL